MGIPNLSKARFNTYCVVFNMQQASVIYLALEREQEEFATLDIKTQYKAITTVNKLISKTEARNKPKDTQDIKT